MSGYIPRRGIAGYYGSSSSSFLKILYTVSTVAAAVGLDASPGNWFLLPSAVEATKTDPHLPGWPHDHGEKHALEV